MANAYWIEHVNKDGFAMMQTLVARSEREAVRILQEYETFTADDPEGTVEVRMTRNGHIVDTIRRKTA